MNDIISTNEEQYIPLWKCLEILGIKKSSFYYLVNTKKIATEPGRGPKDGRYLLADIMRVKNERKRRRDKSPTFTLDWMYYRDLPAALELDYIVYEERLIASIDTYETWLKKNPYIAMSAYDRNDRRRMLAYIGMIPLQESTIMEILTGKRDEMDIKAEEIETYDRPGEYTLLANSAVVHPDRPDLLYQVLSGIMQAWLERYPERYMGRIYAQAASPQGDILISKFFFAPLYQLVDGHALPVKDAYVLDLSRPGASRVIRHFQQQLKEKGIAQPETSLPTLEIPASVKPSRPRERHVTKERQHAATSERAVLPDGWYSVAAFSELHTVHPNTVKKAIQTGRFTAALVGEWKSGRAIVKEALDQAGQQAFIEQYNGHPGFTPCERCPHGAAWFEVSDPNTTPGLWTDPSIGPASEDV